MQIVLQFIYFFAIKLQINTQGIIIIQYKQHNTKNKKTKTRSHHLNQQYVKSKKKSTITKPTLSLLFSQLMFEQKTTPLFHFFSVLIVF